MRIAPAVTPIPFSPALPTVARPAAPLPTAPTWLTPPPIVDFPGVQVGATYAIGSGSKVGPIGVRGDALIRRWEPDHAVFHVKAGRFGFSIDVDVDIVRVDDTTVRISSTGHGIPDMSELGRVVESRENYASFEQVSDPSRRTIIARDGAGHVTIDTVVPTLGEAHLELDPR